ncbi:MAG: hypothetical protein FWG40_02865 [Peptococcaceae bacterium]|nr:hypothetical protein [Peptococcaceae bacterium]
MEKKKTIIATSCAVIALSLCSILCITQIILPLQCSYTGAKIHKYLGDSFGAIVEMDYEQARAGIRPDVQLFSDIDYKFEEHQDYSHITLFYDVRNISIFKISNIEFNVLDLGGIEDRFMFRLDHVVTQFAGRGEKTAIRLDLHMYTKGLSKDEVAEMVKNVKAELRYKQELFGYKRQSISIPSDLLPEEIIVR